ncbi:Putative F-box/FBD/LRR-repeat protein At4g03220 [Linum perenne]
MKTNKKISAAASATTTDRLTNLPESIILHILSFLDTKSSVQTSLLSRSWRSLWKQVAVLDLNRSSSPDSSSFYKFVDNVLSLRNRDLNLRNVTYMNEGRYDVDAISTSKLVFKYAAALADEFSIELRCHDYSRFLGLITTTSSCNLKTMTLRNGRIKNPIEFGSSPGFQSLTSLVLDDCSLWLHHHPDPFAKFPCLKYLVLDNCYIFDLPHHNYTLKVSGRQLLTLKLKVYSSVLKKIEINAPKLQSLYALFEAGCLPEFTEVSSLPSLVHATLHIDWFAGLDLENLVSVFGLVRLTNLPESIIHHILSFLDTKSSIQTSLLSRPWRSLWKQVPVLDLNRSSSPDSSSFYKFVDNVLSLRNRDLNLRKVTYMNKGYDIDTISLSELVFKYAAAHADEFSFELRYQHDYSRFLGLITTTSSCNLKTMTLRNGMINNPIEFGSSPGFQSLTSLVLDDCSLWLQHHPDPFAKFPCLKYLVLYGSCIFDSPDHNYTLKVSGLQLLTLKLNANGCKHKVEINAPKLESLALHMCSHNFPEFTGVSLQSLVHASLFCFYGELERPELPILMSLFRLIGNN